MNFSNDPLYDSNIQSKLIVPTLKKLLIEKLNPPSLVIIYSHLSCDNRSNCSYLVPQEHFNSWIKEFLGNLNYHWPSQDFINKIIDQIPQRIELGIKDTTDWNNYTDSWTDLIMNFIYNKWDPFKINDSFETYSNLELICGFFTFNVGKYF